MAVLSGPTGEQWGMVTAGPARRLGVSRVDLNRLHTDGSLALVGGAARVYRFVGAPEDPDLNPVRAAWLQLGGARTWAELIRDEDAVVSHRSAAHVRGLGDLIPRVHEFYVPDRRRLRRDDLKLRVRSELTPGEWSVWAGLPVCTVDKIITDLLHDYEDESAVAQICRDALRDGLLTHADLLGLVAGHARNYGHRSAEAMTAVLAGRGMSNEFDDSPDTSPTRRHPPVRSLARSRTARRRRSGQH